MCAGVAHVDACLTEEDSAWGYNPYFGRVRDASPTHLDNPLEVYVGDLYEADSAKTIDVYVTWIVARSHSPLTATRRLMHR
jgi:hypothetical protein